MSSTENLTALKSKVLAAMRPNKKQPLAQWADATIILSQSVSAAPGRLRLTKFQRGIADAISDPTIDRVIVQKPARCGYTLLETCAVGWYWMQGAPILIVLPTMESARQYVTSVLEPTFASTPTLRGLLEYDGTETDRNTMLSRRSGRLGSSLVVVSAQNGRHLRAHTSMAVFCDEADNFAPTPDGDAVMLASKRMASFPMGQRKLVIGSSPSSLDTSTIVNLYSNSSDARVFEIFCEGCGVGNEPKWRDIRYEPKDIPEVAVYVCRHCGHEHGEDRKPFLVENAEWRATKPQIKRTAGFRLSGLVSLLESMSWVNLAREFVVAKEHPTLLRPFLNLNLGEPWVEQPEVDTAAIQSRGENFGLFGPATDFGLATDMGDF